MTRLEALMERVRALPLDEQEIFVEEMEAWLDAPIIADADGPDGSDEELAERIRRWEANPVGIPAAELHARLKRQRDNR